MIDVAELRKFVRMEYVEKRRLRELSALTKVSKSYISKWLYNKAAWDTEDFERKLYRLHQEQYLSGRDQLLLQAMRTLLDASDHREQLIEAFAGKPRHGG